MRPLISTSGMSRAFVSSTRLGQISDSTSTARSGRQCCKKRCTKPWLSSGTYWCSTPFGSRVRASRAEVTVAVVSSMRSSGRSAAMVSITGSAALASPTLAAWNQTRKPGGRGELAMP